VEGNVTEGDSQHKNKIDVTVRSYDGFHL